MSENTKSLSPTIIVAIIGAVVTICAAVIAIIPSVLQYIIPSSPTPVLFIETQPIPSPELPIALSDTPSPELPTSIVEFTETPTLTFTPTIPPTETFTNTPVPPPTSQVDAYAGTWVNIENNPTSSKVKLVLTRLVISKTGETSANFSACRKVSGGEAYINPNPASATFSNNILGAADFTISSFASLRWAIKVKISGGELIATVEEYNTSLLFIDADTFQLKKLRAFDAPLLNCQAAVFQ